MLLFGVVDRREHGREVATELAAERLVGEAQCLARRQSSLEVCAHGVMNERGDRQRLAAVPADVTDDDGDTVTVQREHVMEVATGGRALGGAVGNRDLDTGDSLRDRRQQRRLHGADVHAQLVPLVRQPSRQPHQQRGTRGHQDSQRRQRRDRGHQRPGKLFDCFEDLRQRRLLLALATLSRGGFGELWEACAHRSAPLRRVTPAARPLRSADVEARALGEESSMPGEPCSDCCG